MQGERPTPSELVVWANSLTTLVESYEEGPAPSRYPGSSIAARLQDGNNLRLSMTIAGNHGDVNKVSLGRKKIGANVFSYHRPATVSKVA